MDIDRIYDMLASCDKQELKFLVLKLMINDKLSFEEISMVYVNYIKRLKEGVSENFMDLRDKLLDIWIHPKAEMESRLKDAMNFLVNKKVVNMSHEQVNTKNFK